MFPKMLVQGSLKLDRITDIVYVIGQGIPFGMSSKIEWFFKIYFIKSRRLEAADYTEWIKMAWAKPSVSAKEA